MAKNKVIAAEEAVDKAKANLLEAEKTHAADSPEVKAAKEALEVAEGDLSSARGNSGGDAMANRRPATAVKSEARKSKESFASTLGDGVTSTKQAEKIYAICSPIVPQTAEDEDPISWAYVTFDGNIFFKKKAAIKQAGRLSGGLPKSPAGKYFAIKIGE